jgi:hypothetical protein
LKGWVPEALGPSFLCPIYWTAVSTFVSTLFEKRVYFWKNQSQKIRRQSSPEGAKIAAFKGKPLLFKNTEMKRFELYTRLNRRPLFMRL